MKRATDRTVRVRGGFTLMELLVSVSILVLIILGVGQVFRSAGRAIRVSNSMIEVDANARAVMRQFAADVSRIDRDGFIVIRTNWGANPRRAQISFLAHGTHVSRTGGLDPSNLSAGELASHSAHVWYGFGLTPEDTEPKDTTQNRGTFFSQDDDVQLTDVATGGTDSNDRLNFGTLARHVFLLHPANNPNNGAQIVAPDGGLVPAHSDFSRKGGAVAVLPAELAAHPSSGRTSVASLSPGQVMARIRYEKYQAIQIPAHLLFQWNSSPGGSASGASYGYRDGGYAPPLFDPVPPSTGGWGRIIQPAYDGADYWYEARNYCYPFKVLQDPRDGKNAANVQDFTNGTYRLSTLMLKYCQEFNVDWTDGGLDNNGSLRWIGEVDSGDNTIVRSLDVWRERRTNAAPAGTALPPQWPPVDFHARSRMNGAGQTSLYESPYPPLTDKAGELRSMPTYSQSDPANWSYPYNGRNQMVSRDVYTAVFSFDNRDRWPKAIRIRMRVSIPQAEITSGSYTLPTRTYTQVVWLPQ